MTYDNIDTRVKLCALRVKNLRVSSGLSQVEFGKQFGVSGPTIARYETMQRIVPLDLAMKVADRYGVTLDWITGGVDEAPEDIINLFNKLTEKQKKEVVSYARFILERG